MNTIADLHSRITDVLAGCADDAAKLDGGNRAEGGRLKKALKELKGLTKELRKRSGRMRPYGHERFRGKTASGCCDGRPLWTMCP